MSKPTNNISREIKYDLSPYFEFIENCKLQNYDGMITHKHHIIPISMSELIDNVHDEHNLIIISCQDHFKAHWILSECFPVDHIYHVSNLRACGLLFEWAENPELTRQRISDSRKGKNYKTPAQRQAHSNFMKGNKFRLGISHTESTRQLISIKNKELAQQRFPKCTEVYPVDNSEQFYRYCPLCNKKIINKNYNYARLGHINQSKCKKCAQIGIIKK